MVDSVRWGKLNRQMFNNLKVGLIRILKKLFVKAPKYKK
jgi:hypothetical protein